ncbi:MAG: hypothetical protein V9E90_02240 [Saprospiraceae bacterium]
MFNLFSQNTFIGQMLKSLNVDIQENKVKEKIGISTLHYKLLNEYLQIQYNEGYITNGTFLFDLRKLMTNKFSVYNQIAEFELERKNANEARILFELALNEASEEHDGRKLMVIPFLIGIDLRYKTTSNKTAHHISLGLECYNKLYTISPDVTKLYWSEYFEWICMLEIIYCCLNTDFDMVPIKINKFTILIIGKFNNINEFLETYDDYADPIKSPLYTYSKIIFREQYNKLIINGILE